jgi:phosphonatase-like hydrolase
MKSYISLVVFDIAGTTVKDNGEIALAFQKALEVFGYQVPVEQINPLMGYEKQEAIRTMLVEYEQNSDRITTNLIIKIHQRFLNEMIAYYKTTTELQPLPGVEDSFEALKKRGITIGLNTGFSKDITDVIMQRLEWMPQKIDYVISSSEVAKGRPYPFMIHNLMQQAGVTDPKQVIKVGDTEVDIREGQNAGCLYSIGVTTGAFSRTALQTYNPSFIIDNLTELPAIIDCTP